MTEAKRTWGRFSLCFAAALMILFVVLAGEATSRVVACDVTERDCFANAVRLLDPPLLWVLPGIAGLAGGAGALLLHVANRELPPRAIGITWEQWQKERATD